MSDPKCFIPETKTPSPAVIRYSDSCVNNRSYLAASNSYPLAPMYVFHTLLLSKTTLSQLLWRKKMGVNVTVNGKEGYEVGHRQRVWLYKHCVGICHEEWRNRQKRNSEHPATSLNFRNAYLSNTSTCLTAACCNLHLLVNPIQRRWSVVTFTKGPE
jgi:hypothetical protein